MATTKRQPSTARRSSRLVTALAEEVEAPVKKRTYKKRSDSISGEVKPVKKTIAKKVAKPKVVEPQYPIVLGGYCLPIKSETHYGEGAAMTLAKDNKIPGVVIAVTLTAVQVEYPTSAYHPKFRATYHKDTLFGISKEEYVLRCTKLEAEHKAKSEELVRKFQAQFESEHKSVMDRDDYDLNKNFLNSNYNYVTLGSWDANNNRMMSPSKNPGAVCCALTKTTSSIMVHVPKEWANYYGYNLVDIKNWLAFLTHCDIGFKGSYVDKIKLKDEYGATGVPISMPALPNNNFYMRPDMEAYRIVIPTTGHKMVNYMHFILIRYLYNMQYYTIPFIAMQIKRGMGEKITFWEALLVAHMNHSYNGYYCLTANQVDAQLAIPNSNNSPKTVISSLRGNNNMNTSFYYDRRGYKVKDLIRSKNYDAIEKLLETWRK